MTLLQAMCAEAGRRGIPLPDVSSEAERAYALVRDLPYARASDNRPETLIREWRGTCSGKHYLLKALLAELGIRTQVYACTSRLAREDAPNLPEPLAAILAEGPFVDVHNYLVAEFPEGPTIVDATWPLATGAAGLPVNERLTPGQHMRLACKPVETLPIPEDADPDAFKQNLLRSRFTPADLERRERFIALVSAGMSAA